MENKEIASVFRRLAKLMELHGENEFKTRSIQNASFRIDKVAEPIAGMSADTISGLDGIGKSISQKIILLLQTGTLPELDEIESRTPAGVSEMLDIKGLGPKKVGVIWQELGITTPGELLYACNENRLVELKGFGAKTQDSVKQAVEFSLRNAGWFHFAEAESCALSERDFLQGLFPNTSISFTGNLRRFCEVVDSIDILIDKPFHELLAALQKDRNATGSESDQFISYTSALGIPVRIHPVNVKGTFTFRLWFTTGNKIHTSRITEILAARGIDIQLTESETEIYEKAGFPFIPAECREGELEFNSESPVAGLVEFEDLKGCLHNHSTYSDGVHTLRVMADHCRTIGLEYFGICDHSRSAFYANGLSVDRVLEQHKEVDALNQEFAPFRILKGIESDILPDGSLDYPDEILGLFDIVVASVHSGLKMDKTKATERLLKAISNPYTTVLGHPTGRLLLAREGYPVDMEAVIDACVAHNVVIELNANPYRLDIDWRWIRKAVLKGAQISINPDAHRKEGIRDMYYGVCVARKGFLKPEQTFNARNLNSVMDHLANKKQQLKPVEKPSA